MTKHLLWTAEEICAATRSSLCSKDSWEASGITMNSKEVQKGDLFVAIKGEKVDGHDFLDEAFKNGAIAAIVEHAPATDHNYVVVRNTREALMDIGRAARNRLNGTILGITGTAGKTSTKDMLALVLGAQGKTFATKRSFNSTITAPLSLASAQRDIDYGVFEIGMNERGEIAELSKIVRPHIGIITTVGPGHLQNFSSVEEIAQEKASIFLGTPTSGIAILPGDNPLWNILHDTAKARGIEHIYSFGESAHCEARLLKSVEKNGYYHHEVSILGKKYAFKLSLPGKHWALNALMALLVVKLLNKDVLKACETVESYSPPEHRGVPILLQDDILLVDESYNANPISMQVALESFGLRKVAGKKIAILGDMRELGTNAPALHASLAEDVKHAGVSILLTYGENMEHLHSALKKNLESHHFKAMDALLEKIFDILRPHDAMIVKSSLGVGFIYIINALKQALLRE
jgi:UDP-N-acetylmuramoyl-tripeptide--D-alanyl-D-alanine ligase